MKICWITSKMNFTSSGGSIEEIDFVARTLVAKGHELTMVTTYSDTNDISEPIPYRLLGKQFLSHRLLNSTLACVKLFKELERETDVFIVDAHLYMYAAGWYRLTGGRVPVAAFVNQYLTCWPQYASSLFPAEKIGVLSQIKRKARLMVEGSLGMWLASFTDMYAYVSPTLRKMYEDFGMPKRAVDMVIGDPIDIASLRIRGGITENYYREHLKSAPPYTLFFSSRMSPGKGFDMLLKGFSLVRNKEDFHVILGGTGPEEKYVRHMVRDLDLEAQVTIPGWVSKEKLYEYYKEADVFIQADWWPAGTSISLIYALAFGVPSIIPGGGGLEWNAGESALTFPYRDAVALARRIEEMSDAKLRATLSKNCASRLREKDMDYPRLIAEFGARLEALVALRKHA